MEEKVNFKIGVLKNFAIFTGKHLCWSLFLIELFLQKLFLIEAFYIEHLKTANIWPSRLDEVCIIDLKIKKIISYNVFNRGPSKICRKHSLKNLKWYGLHVLCFHHVGSFFGPLCNDPSHIAVQSKQKYSQIESERFLFPFGAMQ